jgi:hypothetical protein
MYLFCCSINHRFAWTCKVDTSQSFAESALASRTTWDLSCNFCRPIIAHCQEGLNVQSKSKEEKWLLSSCLSCSPRLQLKTLTSSDFPRKCYRKKSQFGMFGDMLNVTF